MDAPIGAYWPSFVAEGKETITCRMVLGHRAGIPVLDKTFPGLDVPHGWNDPDLLGMELPGAGAVASASGLAGVYAAAVTGIDGSARLLSPETVGDAMREVSTGAGFLGFDGGARWGSGFLLDSPFRPTLGPRSFANDGARRQVRLRRRRARHRLRLHHQPHARPRRPPSHPHD